MTSSLSKDIKKPNFCAYKCLMTPSYFSLSDSLSQCCIYIYTLIKLSQHLIFTCFNYCVQWSRELIHLNKYRETQIDQIKNFRHAVYSLSFRTNIPLRWISHMPTVYSMGNLDTYNQLKRSALFFSSSCCYDYSVVRKFFIRLSVTSFSSFSLCMQIRV